MLSNYIGSGGIVIPPFFIYNSDMTDIKEFENQIAIVIPSYEPDERFVKLLKDIREEYNGHIIVVNDGSDSSYTHYFDEASALNCEVITHHVNMGKGRGLKNAFNYILNTYPDMIGCVTADSDGQHLPKDIYRIMKELYDYRDCLIMGCRDFDADNVPNKSRVGNKVTRNICRFFCGVNTSDTQTGLRGISREFMKRLLTVDGDRFEFETRMLIESKDNFPIREVSIETVYDSKENHQSHYNPIKDSIRIGKIFAVVFAMFLVSSLSSTMVDLIIFHMLVPVIEPFTALYYVAICTVIARVFSAIYNYMINYMWVFKSKADHRKSAVRYFILAVIQMTLSAIFTTILVRMFGGVVETVLKAIVDVTLFFFSYIIQRTIVFKRD